MERQDNLIRVEAQGTAEGAPDRASIDVGVSVLEKSVEKATARAAGALSSILQAIQDFGVDRADLHTMGHSVRAEYDHSGRTRRLAGYRVVDSVRVTVRNIDRVGEIVDAATDAGGDHVTVERITFDIDDPQELESTARGRAWQAALARATQLASLAGLELGSAVWIREGTEPRPAPPAMMMRAAPMAASADTPIEAGMLAVAVSLTVAFAID
jgi:hypothetical protein